MHKIHGATAVARAWFSTCRRWAYQLRWSVSLCLPSAVSVILRDRRSAVGHDRDSTLHSGIQTWSCQACRTFALLVIRWAISTWPVRCVTTVLARALLVTLSWRVSFSLPRKAWNAQAIASNERHGLSRPRTQKLVRTYQVTIYRRKKTKKKNSKFYRYFRVRNLRVRVWVKFLMDTVWKTTPTRTKLKIKL